MFLKPNDSVRLLPTWIHDLPEAPVWGGAHGYHIGSVKKIITHEHNDKKHVAIVEWDNNEAGSFPESALAETTLEERDIALDFRRGVPIDRDIFVLIKTSRQNFGLNYIERNPYKKDPTSKFLVGTSHRVMGNVSNSNWNLVNSLLSSPDYLEMRVDSLYQAAQAIYNLWELPRLASLPLPLPEYPSIHKAAETSPGGPCTLFFHLPENVNDYSDNPKAVGLVAS